MAVSRTGRWLLRPGIGRRIAVAMSLSLVLVQAQALVQIALFSNAEIRLTGTRWLAETTRDAARAAFDVPGEARVARLRALSTDSAVELSWTKERPWTGPKRDGGAVAARLLTTLHAVLGDDARAIEISTSRLEYLFPINAVRVAVSPRVLESHLGSAPVAAEDAEVLIPTSLRVAVQGRDGTWISVTPIGFEDAGVLSLLPLTPLIVAGLVIAIVSVLSARRIVAPLDRLTDAADRIGTARTFTPVPTAGLGEFAAVAHAFEDMQRRLLRFIEDRTQMLAAISHDLRSALTRMRLAVEEDARESPVLLDEMNDMDAMLDSTLAFASGEACALPSRPTDVAALLISLVDSASDTGKLCTYSGPDHAETAGHPLALKRAFGNVIDNAVKYGKAARVTLRAGDKRLVIEVRDDGPGIPNERIEEAFAPFRRLDPARSGPKSGVGLGLTIARDVIISHGGEIRLEGAASGGLIARIDLPM